MLDPKRCAMGLDRGIYPRNLILTLALLLILGTTSIQGYSAIPPKISPATKLPNQLYSWKAQQQIRYQVNGPTNGEPVVLVHGLFVNSDHWRKALQFLGDQGYRVYALDLWGCGYSSKPPSDSPEAQSVNGENGRFGKHGSILRNCQLGTAAGIGVRIRDVDLSHPLKSPYNFYTWSNLISDFCQDVVNSKTQVTLVANSIGSISSLQAVLDKPELFRGVFIVSPNFRELHSAEIPLPAITMPIVRTIQKLLREKGQGLFDALATPSTVKQILMVPYAITDAVDDTLVDVLLTPLLTEGASQVVFDTLSYSAGPLPEVQLSTFPNNKPVWICYGLDDPWTPAARVEALIKNEAVERVVGFPEVGHCPHDEAPELVHPLLLEYLQRVRVN